MNGIPLLLLMIYSGFTINLLLQCAIGIKGIVESRNTCNLSTYAKLCLVFCSIVFMWFFLSRIVYSIIPGIFIYVLLFPVSAIVYEGLEFLAFRYLLKKEPQSESVVSFPGGITAVAVFICINLAYSFLEAAVLSFGFVFGFFIVSMIIKEIRHRADFEAVPFFLRGKPLVLIAMGLLSLVFTSASLLFFRMIGSG